MPGRLRPTASASDSARRNVEAKDFGKVLKGGCVRSTSRGGWDKFAVSAADVPGAVGDEVRLPGAAGESSVAPGPAGIEAVGVPDDLKTEDQSAETRSAAGTPITSKKINMKTGLFSIGAGSFPRREETATGKAHGWQPVGFEGPLSLGPSPYRIGVSPRSACRRSPRPPELPVSVDPLQLLQSAWQFNSTTIVG